MEVELKKENKDNLNSDIIKKFEEYQYKNYIFDNFVVGDNNRLAYQAAMFVTKSSGDICNPLLLCGAIGLGKTHLMCSIAHEALRLDNDINILYITAKKFINESTNAIKNNRTEQFIDKFKNIDMLLIDDFDFIAVKGKKIQDTFLRIVYNLYINRKQIVISMSKCLDEYASLKDSLKSFLKLGLIADISMVDYETRLSILKRKVKAENIIIDESILSIIAERVNSNIRELEGILNRIVAYAYLENIPITMEMAEKAIKN